LCLQPSLSKLVTTSFGPPPPSATFSKLDVSANVCDHVPSHMAAELIVTLQAFTLVNTHATNLTAF
jgi:hypothetical protein